MTAKSFEPGDAVAIVHYLAWRRGELGPKIVWRGKVEKVHKTGAVVVEPGKYRPNGTPYDGTLFNGELVHLTPELEAQSARRDAILEAEAAIHRFCEKARTVKGDEALALIAVMPPSDIFDRLDTARIGLE